MCETNGYFTHITAINGSEINNPDSCILEITLSDDHTDVCMCVCGCVYSHIIHTYIYTQILHTIHTYIHTLHKIHTYIHINYVHIHTYIHTYILCSLCLYYVYHLTTGLLDLDAGLLARSQNPEGPATGHLDPGFLGFSGY